MNRRGCNRYSTRPIAHRIITGLAHPRVIGYRRHPVLREFWKYMDVEGPAPTR